MTFLPIPIVGAYEIQLSPFGDERGQFSRLFCKDEFKEIAHQKEIVQVNHSVNLSKGTIRGLHFQYPPFAEIKIIRCLRGSAFDVIVDIRKNSSTFLKWHAIELSGRKFNMIYIPEGCAHGFQTIENGTELLYLHSSFYNPTKQGAIRFDDPLIGIQWPMPPINISEKDKEYPFLEPSFSGYAFN